MIVVELTPKNRVRSAVHVTADQFESKVDKRAKLELIVIRFVVMKSSVLAFVRSRHAA
jgi:hypothetical protein